MFNFSVPPDEGFTHYYDKKGNLMVRISKETPSFSIAEDIYYSLWYNTRTCVYEAGCRRFNYTQALKHWDGLDLSKRTWAERSVLFNAAIKKHLAGKSKLQLLRMRIKGWWYA